MKPGNYFGLLILARLRVVIGCSETCGARLGTSMSTLVDVCGVGVWREKVTAWEELLSVVGDI